MGNENLTGPGRGFSTTQATGGTELKDDSGADIELRQRKYLNNVVEQDHRAIKRIVRPMLGFKSFNCARILIAGTETSHMIKEGQLDCPEGQASSAASKFYSLAF